ncbi:AAA family ATPase [Neptunitalea lumnitzerae]|uniref:ATPase AAA-type core domain-containing protein n=1 Tax=Neptunitalea lumnitzerae TaxID=2965509 RepID=A0ABQ5MH50_9FLAO|nr:ATP-binding protein [Neptunitalea sp. Y10]GLB48715.1 hypothetical protein Y10_10830 [Neptunitalea sp. Y10]
MTKVSDKVTNTYIEKVHLNGFNTIKNLDVSLQNGLNIIIGKNASGKTNFMTFLNEIFEDLELPVIDFDVNVYLNGRVEYEYRAYSNGQDLQDIGITRIKDLNSLSESVSKTAYYLVNNKMVEPLDVISNEYKVNRVLIKHGVPSEYDLVNHPWNFNVYEGNRYKGMLPLLRKSRETPSFVSDLSLSFFFNSIGLPKDHGLKNIELVKSTIRETGEVFFKSIKEKLKRFTLIQDVRLSENLNLFFDDSNDLLSLNNLFLEFYVNNNWLPFSSLSDGTKRLFYIISECNSLKYKGEIKMKDDVGVNFNIDNRNKIILLEEPELGLHPHQLMNLLQFLKEESLNKQIIITTHSPMVLDVLDKTELDRIIIASYSLEEKRTLMRHLSEEEKEKAQLYMEDDYLSDYWKYSDLEE